jgi:hypothetical protein
MDSIIVFFFFFFLLLDVLFAFTLDIETYYYLNFLLFAFWVFVTKHFCGFETILNNIGIYLESLGNKWNFCGLM